MAATGKDDIEADVTTTSNTSHDKPDINASGHVQELEKNFSLLSIIGVGVSVGNVWPALGGSILVALYNGGPPGELPTYQQYQIKPC